MPAYFHMIVNRKSFEVQFKSSHAGTCHRFLMQGAGKHAFSAANAKLGVKAEFVFCRRIALFFTFLF